MEGKDQHTESDLHFLDYWRVLRSRKEVILAVTLLIVVTGAAFTFTLPKIYQAEARIAVYQDELDVDVFGPSMQGYSYNPYFLRTQFEIIQSKPILYKVIQNLKLDEVWGKEMTEDGRPLPLDVAQALLKRDLEVEQYRDTSLIAIRIESERAEETWRIANEIAAVYRDHRIAQKMRVTERGIEALVEEVQKMQLEVDRAEEKLEGIRQEQGVNTIQGGIRADKVQLGRLEADRISARVDLLVRESRLKQLQDLQGDALMNASAYIVQDPVIATIRRQLIDTDVSLSLLLEQFGENHPEVKRLRAAEKQLRVKMTDALDGLKKGLQADYAVAKAKYEVLEKELESARKQDIVSEGTRYLPFVKAQRDLNLKRSILQSLQAKVAQEGIKAEVPRTPVELVDPAEQPKHHVKPNVLLNVLLSLVLGLGAGVGLAFFIEYLDTSVKTVDEIERFLGLPVIGVIPQKVGSLAEEGPDSPHSEAYRVLRTNMQFNNKGRTGGTFAVVSGGVGEGKSTTLFNLAFVCAQLGEKVLIVDSDLRRPVQHKALGISNRFGLTNVLMRDVPIEETIKVTDYPNLHFLPSGKLPRSSLGLLDSQRMHELVKNLKARYDYVFFDSPPVMGVSDASVLASEVDGVLLVVQYRKYPRQVSARAKRLIDNVGGNLLGVVLNNINIMRDDYYYYYHSYYSQYYLPDQVQEDEDDKKSARSPKAPKREDRF